MKQYLIEYAALLNIVGDNFESGYDSRFGGSAFAVYYRGEKVVDLWGGLRRH